MEYLKIRCGTCKNIFDIYQKDIDGQAPRCPHCLAQMDAPLWDRLTAALSALHEANKTSIKAHEDKGAPLFSCEIVTEKYHVKPENIKQ